MPEIHLIKENRMALLLLGGCLALGTILGATIMGRALRDIKVAEQGITVKGFAQRQVRADSAVWRGRVEARAKRLPDAYSRLKRDVDLAMAYLVSHGVEKETLDLSPVQTRTEYRISAQGHRTNEIERYVLSRTVSLHSNDVEHVAKLAAASNDLVRKGLRFVSEPPEYYISDLDRIKVELIGEAAKNAQSRAQQLAAQSAVEVGALRSATQGVFQITRPLSSDVSSYGHYDTSTIDKAVKAVVTMEYGLQAM